MVTLASLTVLENANQDLDDMDFTHLWGKEEGLELFSQYISNHEGSLLDFISDLSPERKELFVNYINEQFTP